MHQRLTAAVLGVLGAVLVALGIASATVWRADDVLVATGRATDATTLIVADPGVLSLADDSVTITARAPGDGTVVIAVGRDTDVAGWVGTDPHTQISGLSSWHVLASALVPAGGAGDPTDGSTAAPTDTASSSSSTPAPSDGAPAAADTAATGAAAGDTAEVAAPDPSTSDMWVAQASGPGTASLSWTAQPGRWSLLVATTGEGAGTPTVELAWPQKVRTPWLVPCVVAGGLMMLAAAGVLLRRRLRTHGGLTVTWNAVESGETPVVTGAAGGGDGRGAGTAGEAEASSTTPLTRRQLRERERTAPTPVVAPRLTVRRREPASGAQSTLAPSATNGSVQSSELPSVPEPSAAHPSTPGGFTPSTGSVPSTVDGPSSRSMPWRRTPPEQREPGTGDAPRPDAARSVHRSHRGETEPTSRPSVASPPSPDPVRPSVVGPTSGSAAGRSWTPVPSSSGSPVPQGRDTAAAPPAATEREPGTDTPGAGARADAWRRAWGFPGVEQDDTDRDDDGKER